MHAMLRLGRGKQIKQRHGVRRTCENAPACIRKEICRVTRVPVCASLLALKKLCLHYALVQFRLSMPEALSYSFDVLMGSFCVILRVGHNCIIICMAYMYVPYTAVSGLLLLC